MDWFVKDQIWRMRIEERTNKRVGREGILYTDSRHVEAAQPKHRALQASPGGLGQVRSHTDKARTWRCEQGPGSRPHVLFLLACTCSSPVHATIPLTLTSSPPALVHSTGVSLCLSESVFFSSLHLSAADRRVMARKAAQALGALGLSSQWDWWQPWLLALADLQQGVRSLRSGRDDQTSWLPDVAIRLRL